MQSYRNQGGYTLMEILVAIFLLSLCMSMAVPAMSAVVRHVRLKSGTEAFTTSLNMTRIEAIRRNARVVLCKSLSGEMCSDSSAWEQGWIIFQDANGNSEVDPGEDIFYREAPLSASVRVTGNTPVNSYVAYTGLGRTSLTSGAFQAGTITVCQPSLRPDTAYQIVINSTGRARVAKTVVERCT